MKMQPFRTGVVSAFAAGLIALGGGAALQKAEAASVKPASVTYKVTNSDTLYQIAKKYGINLNAVDCSEPGHRKPEFHLGGLIVNVPVTEVPAAEPRTAERAEHRVRHERRDAIRARARMAERTAERARRIKTHSPRKS